MSKYIDSSDRFKYVSLRQTGKRKWWWGQVLGRGKAFNTEREAAVYVDVVLIKNKRKPVNILRPA
jgi:hypothetical protein